MLELDHLMNSVYLVVVLYGLAEVVTDVVGEGECKQKSSVARIEGVTFLEEEHCVLEVPR
jgi:hypothetical protein